MQVPSICYVLIYTLRGLVVQQRIQFKCIIVSLVLLHPTLRDLYSSVLGHDTLCSVLIFPCIYTATAWPSGVLYCMYIDIYIASVEPTSGIRHSQVLWLEVLRLSVPQFHRCLNSNYLKGILLVQDASATCEFILEVALINVGL